MPRVAPVPGDVIEDYEILEKIGGNMGLVYKARHRLLNKVVALKLFPADWIADSARLARFHREIRVMGQLEHPNLVTAADARSVDEWHLVTMEWIEGVDLQQLVRSRGPLPVAIGCEAIRQAALGLQYAHQHGLIHRDIKPSNLMLTRSGMIKVIDMGLALTKEDTAAQLTQTGLVLGTMTYCAPEQFRDASRVDIRADIYSLGCTLYHLLAGKAPYCEQKTFAGVVQAHLNEPFPSLAESRSDIPAGLETALARMTAKESTARFATPSDVAEALEPFARGADLKRLVPAKTQRDAPHQPTPVRATPSPKGPPPASGEQPQKRRWAPIAIAAVLVLLLAIAGAVFLAINRSKRELTVTNSAPVVVLMDTTAPHGIYDDDNKIAGRSNAKELYELLQREIKEIPPENIDEQSVGLNWDRRNRVRLQRPHLVVIHRSVFYHPVAATLGFPYPDEKMTAEEFKQFEQRYKILGDDKLREFLGDIGSSEPRTKFLVYSRGTDTNWVSGEYRLKWTRELEAQYPTLKGRVTTMLIEGEMIGGKMKSSFRNPKTHQEFVKRVREILGIPPKRD